MLTIDVWKLCTLRSHSNLKYFTMTTLKRQSSNTCVVKLIIVKKLTSLKHTMKTNYTVMPQSCQSLTHIRK